jgi:RNA polymerase sigma-70 factor (ECF subfamily)
MVSTNASDRPEEETDGELVALAVRGDTGAFHELTVRYYRPVCGFVLKRVQQPDLVEDLVQETFLEAFRAIRNGDRPLHFSSWLFGIAHNRCGKWFRRKRPTLFSPTDPPVTLATPSFVAAQEELEEQQFLLKALEDGLASLPEESRRLLHMKHQQGMTCEQIAAKLGQPTGTIKSQLSRAYKTLRTRIRRPGDNQP